MRRTPPRRVRRIGRAGAAERRGQRPPLCGAAAPRRAARRPHPAVPDRVAARRGRDRHHRHRHDVRGIPAHRHRPGRDQPRRARPGPRRAALGRRRPAHPHRPHQQRRLEHRRRDRAQRHPAPVQREPTPGDPGPRPRLHLPRLPPPRSLVPDPPHHPLGQTADPPPSTTPRSSAATTTTPSNKPAGNAPPNTDDQPGPHHHTSTGTNDQAGIGCTRGRFGSRRMPAVTDVRR